MKKSRRVLVWFLGQPALCVSRIAWLNSHLRQIGSWRHLFAILPDKRKRRFTHVADAAVMSLHIVVWFVIPSLYFPVSFSDWFQPCCGSVCLAIRSTACWPWSLSGRSAVHRQRGLKRLHSMQTATTINFSTGPIRAFRRSGLQYQIEHHLFRTAHSLRKMAPLVKEFPVIQNGYRTGRLAG